jgi:hypothetical protein
MLVVDFSTKLNVVDAPVATYGSSVATVKALRKKPESSATMVKSWLKAPRLTVNTVVQPGQFSPV